ncbi:hypothetical protein [Tropicimonas marinistellae]|uniref:hypothetical protein n=1 Tax=Tropicimonas marinistellae TaxID=1739787 RepID=UPI00083332A7|nr:hypothetical protein [Tropicimonas marinistellae]
MSFRSRFWSSVRSGLSTSLADVERDDGVPEIAGASLDLRAVVHGLGQPIDHIVTLAGPADVKAISADAVRATFPEPDARDAEPNYFPFVELVTPELPWMFTPAQPNDEGRLLPWLVLVVLEETDTVALTKVTEAPGYRLKIESGAGQKLPDLAEAHGWAHAEAVMEGSEGPEISRLLCPVRMKPRTGYLAALVPSFEAGRLAGLGRDPSGATGLLAWDEDTEALELPVYYHWRFGTGQADFEELVRRLTPFEAGGDVGVHDLDISVPRGGLNADEVLPGWNTEERAIVSYAGALVSPVVAPANWRADHKAAFQDALKSRLVSDGEGAPVASGGYDALRDDPVVGVPNYGTWQVSGSDEAPQTLADGAWRGTVNLQAPERASAGVGAEIVRRFQEHYMTEAWAVAANHREITGTLQRARMAQTVGNAVHVRLSALSQPEVLQVTKPVHSEIRGRPDVGDSTVADVLHRTNSLPGGAFEAVFRRATVRADGVARRVRPVDWTDIHREIGTMWLDGTGQTLMQSVPGRADGLVENRTIAFAGANAGTRLPPERLEARQIRLGTRGGRRRTDGASLGHGILRVSEVQDVYRVQPEVLPANALVETTLEQLEPDETVTRHAQSRIDGLERNVGGRVPIPAVAAVELEFRDPAYLDLQRVSPELLLPGYGALPDNSVSLMTVNQAFIEAFLLGLNHEMSRELAWRQYPADLRSSWFRTFWDYVGAPERRDIEPVADWGPFSELGSHQPPRPQAEEDEVVVLVKGDLFRRYPETRVYAAPALWAPPDPAASLADRFKPADALAERRIADLDAPDGFVWPSFEGVIGAKGVFFGFPRSAATLRGSKVPGQDPGYFIVFEQPETDSRFGLDAGGDFGQHPGSRLDLSWGNFAADAGELDGLSHAPLRPDWWQTPVDGLQWGANSAVQAALCFQNPVRVAMHADSLIAEGGQ